MPNCKFAKGLFLTFGLASEFWGKRSKCQRKKRRNRGIKKERMRDRKVKSPIREKRRVTLSFSLATSKSSCIVLFPCIIFFDLDMALRKNSRGSWWTRRLWLHASALLYFRYIRGQLGVIFSLLHQVLILC